MFGSEEYAKEELWEIGAFFFISPCRAKEMAGESSGHEMFTFYLPCFI